MRSLLGRNVQLCSEKYTCRVNYLINPNFSFCFIYCKYVQTYIESEMTVRSTL